MTDYDHYDDVESLDAANHVVFEQRMALRHQPPAPCPTEYLYVDSDGHWVRHKCGHTQGTRVPVEAVRRVVRESIPENERAGGGGIKAVRMDQVEKYA